MVEAEDLFQQCLKGYQSQDLEGKQNQQDIIGELFAIGKCLRKQGKHSEADMYDTIPGADA